MEDLKRRLSQIKTCNIHVTRKSQTARLRKTGLKMERKLSPVKPGEVLLEEFLIPVGISQNHLAIKIKVPARRINEIVLGKRRITADTAL
jgi:hypothetical protein